MVDENIPQSLMDNLETQGCPNDLYVAMGEEREQSSSSPAEDVSMTKEPAARRGRRKTMVRKPITPKPPVSAFSEDDIPSNSETLLPRKRKLELHRAQSSSATASPPTSQGTSQPPRVAVRKKAQTSAS